MHRARAFLREMAQPATAADTVALDFNQLTKHSSYVATAASSSTAAITSHPLQAVDPAAAIAANESRRRAEMAMTAGADQGVSDRGSARERLAPSETLDKGMDAAGEEEPMDIAM